MRPDRVLVIDVGHLADNDQNCNKFTDLSLYPGAMVCKGWQPPTHQLVDFLRDVDVVFSAETFYSDQLVGLARIMDVRTVLQPNWEFFRQDLPSPNVLAVPSLWHWHQFPANKVHLPVPIALDRFETRARGSSPRHFLHIVGRPAIFDRNGTGDLLNALRHVQSSIVLTIRCQSERYVRGLLASRRIPSNVDLRVDTTNVHAYWSLYDCGDVMILPRRFGGLCLPANEALGAGMPVIMPDISPNNTWLPTEWLVPARRTEQFQAANLIDVFTVDHTALAAKIDQFATDDDFYAAAQTRASELAKEYSWDNLFPEYEKVLG